MLPTDIFLSFNVGELTKYLLRMSLSIVLLERYNSMMMMMRERAELLQNMVLNLHPMGVFFPLGLLNRPTKVGG